MQNVDHAGEAFVTSGLSQGRPSFLYSESRVMLIIGTFIPLPLNLSIPIVIIFTIQLSSKAYIF